MPLFPAMFVPGPELPGAVEGVLNAINVEEETIREIVAILEDYADALGQGRPGTIRENAYGGSSKGGLLGHHTRLAHDHVFEAMTTMMDTLSGTSQRVQAYHDDIIFKDEDSADRSRHAQSRYGLTSDSQPGTHPAAPGHPVREA